MNNKIKICLYNCQSITNKSLSINQYMSDNKIDILCLNETFLNESIKSINLLNNYYVIRQDRKQKGGGVAFILHKHITCDIIESKTTQDHEFIAIEITSAEEKISLLNAYVHPKSKTDFNFVNRIAKRNSKMILVGDLNSTNISWSCNSTNTRGKRLDNICSENNLFILNSSTPTSRKSTNIIDMVICGEILFNRIEDVTVDTNFDMSDHWPVYFNLSFKPGKPLISKINWNNFKSDLQLKLEHKQYAITTNEDLDDEAKSLSQDVVDLMNKNTSKVDRKSYKSKIPNDLFKMIKAKKKLNRIYSDTHDPDIKNLLNSLSNQIKRFNKKLLNENWNNQCAFLADKKPSEPVYWRIIKQIESGNQPKNQAVLPGIKSSYDKAEIFSDFYGNIFKNNYFDRNFNNIFDPGINEFIPISVEECISVIKSTKSTNSTGIDGISYKVIKNLPDIVYKHLTILFNYSLKLNYVPNCWKVAKIKVLKKKSDDLDNPGSYRPISLLATISRILEKIMNIRLTDWAETNNLLHVNQSGFRKDHSCQDNIFKMIETCKVGLQCELKCGRVDFDVEKAFDQAPHKGILLSLKEYNCPSYIGNWLVSFFTNRKFVVEVDGSFSSEKDILAGVPQGSPLSPLLFALYINELGTLLDKHDVQFALFADDVTIWSIERNLFTIELLLQLAINEINDFFIRKGLKLNSKKCIYTVFTTKPKDRLNLFISNEIIQYEQNPKLLGIYFDPKLKFTFHFQDVKKLLVSKINLLKILSNRSNRINVNYLLTIYKSLILSKLQYSMLPFLVTTNKIKKEIQSIQNKCLKIILNQPIQTSSKLTHTTLKCVKLDKRFSTLTCNFLTKAKTNNPSILAIFENHNMKRAKYSKSKRSILDRINTITLTPQLSTTQFY